MNDNNGYKGVRTAIVIPTLCRDQHLQKCLESLEANPWAKYVDLYIALDYPLKESHRPGYEKILKLMERDFSAFRSFHLYKRESNYGVFGNSEAIIREAFEECDQYIYSEDDNVFSENYLEYMLKALDYFRDDPDVISVGGYSYPVKISLKEGTNIFIQNAIFNMWGAGFWKTKREIFEKEITADLSLIRDYPKNIKKHTFSRYRWVDYVNCVAGIDPDDRNVREMCPLFSHSSDMAMGVYMQVNGKYQAMPAVSKVRNLGFDGSGLYCGKIEGTVSGEAKSDTYNYTEQPIDQASGFELLYDMGESKEKAFKALDDFVEPDLPMSIRAKLKYFADHLLGRKRLFRLRKLAKRIK